MASACSLERVRLCLVGMKRRWEQQYQKAAKIVVRHNIVTLNGLTLENIIVCHTSNYCSLVYCYFEIFYPLRTVFSVFSLFSSFPSSPFLSFFSHLFLPLPPLLFSFLFSPFFFLSFPHISSFRKKKNSFWYTVWGNG